MIGLSVYPYWDMKANLTKSWQETIEKFTANINRMWTKYHKPMMVVEAGVEVKKPVEGKQIMSAIIHASKNNTNGHCKGVFYWAPELEGQYPLGAFQDGKPTVIMEAFTEVSRCLIAHGSGWSGFRNPSRQ
jgi:arabinogalactan endo-1,4-beta-galactosidase